MRMLALAAALVAVGVIRQAEAADRYISPQGSDTANDCLTSASPCRTIEQGLAQALSGDTVNVAAGSYTEGLVMLSPTTLTVLGGWDEQFNTRDPLGNPAVIRATPLVPQGNRAWTVRGGDVNLTIDGFVIRDGESDEGQSPRHGGGLLVFANTGPITLDVRNATFTRNFAKDKNSGFAHGTNGGGVALEGSHPLDASFTNVTFSRNRAELGGGLYAAGANTTVTLTNCLFTKNKKYSAYASSYPFTSAAVEIGSGANASIINSTIIKNRGPVAARVTDATVSLTNTVIWQRTATADLQVYGTVSADHCDIGTVDVTGPGVFIDLGGNISADPRVRPDGTIRDAASPLIDAGTCAGAPATDFEGDPRPTGGGCDIGADEFVP